MEGGQIARLSFLYFLNPEPLTRNPYCSQIPLFAAWVRFAGWPGKE